MSMTEDVMRIIAMHRLPLSPRPKRDNGGAIRWVVVDVRGSILPINYHFTSEQNCLNFCEAVNQLTTKQAAEILGVNPSRIRQLVLSGELHAEKVGRDLFISQAEMDRFMRERTTAKAKRKGRMT